MTVKLPHPIAQEDILFRPNSKTKSSLPYETVGSFSFIYSSFRFAVPTLTLFFIE